MVSQVQLIYLHNYMLILYACVHVQYVQYFCVNCSIYELSTYRGGLQKLIVKRHILQQQMTTVQSGLGTGLPSSSR